MSDERHDDEPDDGRGARPGDPASGGDGTGDPGRGDTGSGDTGSGDTGSGDAGSGGTGTGPRGGGGGTPPGGPPDDGDDLDDGDFDGVDGPLDPLNLDDHEIEHVRRDLEDLADFEAAFRAEGYRGVAVWCQDCAEEHFYPWDMLRENLRVLIETGETPVHEPAFAPEPERYVPWDYARGYVDALRDVGVDQRLDVEACPRCRLTLTGEAAQANYCPRCAAPLLAGRLLAALQAHGVDRARIEAIMREAGLPG